MQWVVPTKEANASGNKATKQILNMLKDQPLMQSQELTEEKELIKAETRAILEKLLEFGEGDIAVGTVRGFQAGVIDVPFAPSRYNAGKLLPARDYYGAVRLLDFGNLPFGEDIKEIHREKIAQRGKTEGREPSFQMVIDDIMPLAKECW